MTSFAKLSRVISHALRHEPWLYELELDEAGWVSVSLLLGALRAEVPAWALLSEEDLRRMITFSKKKRHELLGGKIRALYGHSTQQKIMKEPAEPPSILYHGTAPTTAARIREDGLRPMGRQYVHLSADMVTAMKVGERKATTPVVLSVRAGEAHRVGVRFYRGNALVWLADEIAQGFIDP